MTANPLDSTKREISRWLFCVAILTPLFFAVDVVLASRTQALTSGDQWRLVGDLGGSLITTAIGITASIGYFGPLMVFPRTAAYRPFHKILNWLFPIFLTVNYALVLLRSFVNQNCLIDLHQQFEKTGSRIIYESNFIPCYNQDHIRIIYLFLYILLGVLILNIASLLWSLNKNRIKT